MTLARECDGCGVVLKADNVYFDICGQEKDPGLPHEQDDTDSSEGDYCFDCMLDGVASLDILCAILRAGNRELEPSYEQAFFRLESLLESIDRGRYRKDIR